MVGIARFVVARVRAASGGHTQLTLRRGNEVLDGICFGRSDHLDRVREGQVVDSLPRRDATPELIAAPEPDRSPSVFGASAS
jgi:hypothetical protein